MKIKNSQLENFFIYGNRYVEHLNPQTVKNITINHVKLKIAIKSVIKEIEPLVEKFRQERETIQLNNCLVDEAGAITYSEKNEFKFTPEKSKKNNKEVLLLNKKTHNIKPFFTERVGDVGIPVSILENIVYKVLTDEEELAQFENLISTNKKQ